MEKNEIEFMNADIQLSINSFNFPFKKIQPITEKETLNFVVIYMHFLLKLPEKLNLSFFFKTKFGCCITTLQP